MINLRIVSQAEVSENQVLWSPVAKTQQSDAKRLTSLGMSVVDTAKYLSEFFFSKPYKTQL